MGVISWGAIQYLMNEIPSLKSELTKQKKYIKLIYIYMDKIQKKIKIDVFTLTKKLTLFYFSFY